MTADLVARLAVVPVRPVDLYGDAHRAVAAFPAAPEQSRPEMLDVGGVAPLVALGCAEHLRQRVVVGFRDDLGPRARDVVEHGPEVHADTGVGGP